MLLLLGAWPFVSFLDHNRDDAPVYWLGIAGYGVGFVAFLLMVAALGGLLLGRARSGRIANTLGVGAVCLFNYLAMAGPLSQLGISLGTVKIAIWLVVSLALMGLVWRLSSRPQVSMVLCAAAAVMVAIPAARLAVFAIEAGRISDAGAAAATAAGKPPGDAQPSVYWVVLDAYTRADALEAYFGYKNQRFLSALRDRRFHVADSAYTNYASTKLAISTIGAMDYYLPVGEPMHPSLWTARLQGFNRVVDRFVTRGYRYVHVEPGGNNGKTRCGGREALCITSKPGGTLSLDEAEVALLKLTPLYPIFRRLFPGFLSFDFTGFDDVTGKLTIDGTRPTFAFVHILSPHPPARYNPDCSRIKQVAWDLVGADESNSPESYLTDLKCLNAEVIAFVDNVLSNDPNDPIIIIQGDHGYRGDADKLPAPSIEAIDRRLVRYAILHAMRLPERCDGMPRHDMTSVNTFRIVFTCLGDSDLAQLPDRLFKHSRAGLRPLQID